VTLEEPLIIVFSSGHQVAVEESVDLDTDKLLYLIGVFGPDDEPIDHAELTRSELRHLARQLLKIAKT